MSANTAIFMVRKKVKNIINKFGQNLFIWTKFIYLDKSETDMLDCTNYSVYTF